MRIAEFFMAALGLVRLAALPSSAADYLPSAISPPEPLREFRGAWIATVANIDWPSRKGLSSSEQKAELTALLDRAAQLKLNAIILQVRPACDALYASPIEPWSEYLSGTMGKPPEPFYDPLAFAIKEAHLRGLELHAWLNPFRARHSSGRLPVAASHVSRTHPQWVRQYGKYLWLDPGEKEAQDYSLSVIMDVVKRYDVDGVHFDDYFYPYKEQDAFGNDLDFPDGPSWKHFGAGLQLRREDWRRQNINAFIERVYTSVKAAKPWVKVGVSPFGIWRPGFPAQIRGYDAYANLYADSRKWLAEGWLDYFAPQLYWAIKPPDQSFAVLLKWWAQQNPRGRHLWPGLDSAKVGERKWQAEEIVDQVRFTRKQPGASGQIHWNLSSLLRASNLATALEREVYAQPALAPASPWLGSARQGTPKLTIANRDNDSSLRASWVPTGQEPVCLWLLQTRSGHQWTTEILPAARTSRVWSGLQPEVIAVSAVDRIGNASSAVAAQRRAP